MSQAIRAQQEPISDAHLFAMEIQGKLGLDTNRASHEVTFQKAGKRAGFCSAVIASQPLQLPATPTIHPTVTGPQDCTACSSDEQRDDRAAAALGRKRTGRGAKQMLIHLL